MKNSLAVLLVLAGSAVGSEIPLGLERVAEPSAAVLRLQEATGKTETLDRVEVAQLEKSDLDLKAGRPLTDHEVRTLVICSVALIAILLIA